MRKASKVGVNFVKIPFIHLKEEQEGDDHWKNLPQVCFSNPFEFQGDVIIAISEYLSIFIEVLW